jgi:hypothetical protein
MNVSPTEARDALLEVARTSVRSAQSRGYRYAAPHLLLWGTIWIIGYGAPVLWPGVRESWCWVLLDVIGMVGSSVIVICAPRPDEELKRSAKGLWAGLALATLFIIATFLVMHPAESAQYHVYPALVLGLVYGLIGLFALPKFLWVGAVVSLSSLLAFFFLQPYLSLCIAAAGGGGLVIGGLWMRRL